MLKVVLDTKLEREAVVVPGEAGVGGAIPEDPADERVLACAWVVA